MDLSHVAVSVENRKEELYTPPRQSANTLFRFFEKSDFLFETIEKQAMIPRYYSENIKYLNIGMRQIAYPMICFCDITVHRLEEHINLYGKYGIAFSKYWGIEKGIQPLQYVNKHSILCQDFSEAFNYSLQREQEDPAKNFLLTQMFYMKPIDGTMPRHGENITKNFTDECEWRYIPNVGIIDLPQVVNESEFAAIDGFNKTIKEMNSVWLHFEINEVKYIIIESERDFDELCKVLDRAIEDDSIRRKLISKIIIWDKAKEDF